MANCGMLIDVSLCTGCYNCFLACRDEFCGNDYSPHSADQPYSGQFWMRIIEKERGEYPKVKVAYTPLLCQQCENAPCVEVASDNAVYRREDGIIIIDPEKAMGQEEIVSACPYRVIYWNKEKKIPQKCTFCAHLLDKGWKEPRCAEACPTGALTFGDWDDPNGELSRTKASQDWEILQPEYGLKTRVLYKGLPKRFIAGEVIFRDRDDECAENVNVTMRGQDITKTIKTDNFGDFEIEGLDSNVEYTVILEYPGYVSREFKVKTRTDVCLGEIIMDRE